MDTTSFRPELDKGAARAVRRGGSPGLTPAKKRIQITALQRFGYDEVHFAGHAGLERSPIDVYAHALPASAPSRTARRRWRSTRA
jgi:hypothetical protein